MKECLQDKHDNMNNHNNKYLYKLRDSKKDRDIDEYKETKEKEKAA